MKFLSFAIVASVVSAGAKWKRDVDDLYSGAS